MQFQKGSEDGRKVCPHFPGPRIVVLVLQKEAENRQDWGKPWSKPRQYRPQNCLRGPLTLFLVLQNLLLTMFWGSG